MVKVNIKIDQKWKREESNIEEVGVMKARKLEGEGKMILDGELRLLQPHPNIEGLSFGTRGVHPREFLQGYFDIDTEKRRSDIVEYEVVGFPQEWMLHAFARLTERPDETLESILEWMLEVEEFVDEGIEAALRMCEDVRHSDMPMDAHDEITWNEIMHDLIKLGCVMEDDDHYIPPDLGVSGGMVI